MATTARADLAVWRNDDVWEYPIEVRGLDLRVVSLAMQVRLAPDTPGDPEIDLVKVTAANAEGLRVAGVRTEAGVIISDLRVRLNKSTRQSLPYAGEVGDSAVLAYALLIGGRTRLVGNLSLLAHAYGSNAAPADRQPGYGAAAGAALPSAGAVLSIAGQDVTVLSIDGLDMVQPLIARAETAAGAAEAAQGQAGAAATDAEAARDAAIAAGRTFPTIAAGVAASAEGQYFTVPGAGATALSLYRREGGAGSLKATFPSLAGLDAFGTAAAVVPGVQQDQSAALNAQLADPGIKRLIAPSGVIWVSRTVRTPGGTKLELQPDTVIRALPTFAIVEGRNHIVLLEGNGAAITGGTVDAAKVGLGGASTDRINGVTVLNGARDCVREGCGSATAPAMRSTTAGTKIAARRRAASTAASRPSIRRFTSKHRARMGLSTRTACRRMAMATSLVCRGSIPWSDRAISPTPAAAPPERRRRAGTCRRTLRRSKISAWMTATIR
ncbi:hypothetical protein ACVOMT_13705 [Sphingomonas panni]